MGARSLDSSDATYRITPEQRKLEIARLQSLNNFIHKANPFRRLIQRYFRPLYNRRRDFIGGLTIFTRRARVYQRGTVDLKLRLTGREAGGRGESEKGRKENRGEGEERRRGWQSGRTAPKLHQLPVPVSWGAIKLPTHFPGHYRASPSRGLPFVWWKRRVRRGGPPSRGSRFQFVPSRQDRFPPPRTVDSNCFCPGTALSSFRYSVRGTPGVRRASGMGNRWLWHRVASNSWNLTGRQFWDRFDKFLRRIDPISAVNLVDDILQVVIMVVEEEKYVNEKKKMEKSVW